MAIRFLSVCLLAAALCACSSTEVVRTPLDISIGQQLIDLKKAHTSGALSDREYEQQRKQLIRNVQ